MTAEELSEQTNPLLNENNGFAFVSGQHQPTLTFTTGMQLSKSKYGTSASSVEGSMFGLQSRRKSKVSSVQSSVTITRKISKFFKRVYKSLMESTAVTSVIILSEDLRARVIISLSLSILYLAAVIVAVKFLATPTFPSIMSFNGFLIAFQLLIGFTAYGVRAVHREFTDSIISAKMIRGTATFKEVGSDARSRNVHDDIYLRISTKICGFILQISLIVLSLSMQWNLVIQSLGNYGCTPATYPTAVLPLPNFGDYLQGDVEFAEIYNYAIPLSDGAVGGWAAWPLAAPTSAFSVTGSGISYLIQTSCGDAQLSTITLATNGTKATLLSSGFATVGNYSALVQIVYPPQSHSVVQWKNSPIQQQCTINVMSSPASLTFSFTVDEWLMVTGGQIQTLTVGSKTVTQRMTKDYSSADIANQILNPLTFANMTTWIANGIESVFDGTEYVSTQGATFCNLLSWGTMPDGLYYPNITFQAVSSVVAAVSHFMSMQYDGSVVGMCEFQGYAKAGNITVPSASSSFVIAMSIITMALLFVQLGKFSWSFWPTWRSNKAYRVLSSPLRLVNDIKLTTRHLFKTEDNMSNARTYQLVNEFGNVKLKYGEPRVKNRFPEGYLMIDSPAYVDEISG